MRKLPDSPPKAALASAALQRQAVRQTVAAGLTIFHQGDVATELFAIERGRVKLWRTLDEGVTLTLGYYDGGDYLGAIAVLQDRPHSVNATAMDELTLLAWPAALIRRLVGEDPVLATELAVEVASRAEGLILRAEDLSSASVESRIARILLRYRGHLREVAQGPDMTLHITQSEIADLTLSTVPTVSRILKRWRAAGLVEVRRGRLTILDLEGLRGLRGMDG